MGKDRLEDYIKDQLSGHQSEVNAENLWRDIKTKQQPKKEKRRFLPWIFLSVGLLCVGGLYLWNTNFKSASSIEELRGSYKSEPTPIIHEATVADKDLDESIAIEEQLEAKQKIEKEETQSVNLKNTDVSRSKIKASNDQIDQTTQQARSEKLITSNRIQENQSQQSLNKRDVAPRKSIPTSSNAQSNFSSEWHLPRAKETISKASSRPTKETTIIDAVQLLALQELIWNRNIKVGELILAPKEIAMVQDKLWKRSLQLQGSYSKGNRILTTQDSISDLLAMRKDHEKFVEAWGLGLETEFVFKDLWTISTGLNFNQFNDRSILSGTYTQLLVPNQSNLLTAEQFERSRIRYNKIQMWDLPILMGYQKRVGNCIISAKAGVNINLNTKAKGNIIGINDFVNTTSNKIIKSNLGISYLFELGLERSLNENWSIEMGLVSRIYPNSVTAESYSIEQKYQTLGLKLGVNRNF